MIKERISALHVLLTAADHATCATTYQILTCNKCLRDVMIIVAGKVATAVFSMFTKKINYPHLCGSTLMRFRML